MTNRFSISTMILMLLVIMSCSAQETTNTSDESKKAEPHRYGGWFCPDNFGFVPVDIHKLDEVPAVSNRLPTEQELKDNMSLINVDTEKYPDARALDMDLPRVARIYSDQSGLNELVIVIQAIVVSSDTIVGYRFPNGGNGSAWMSDVTFLSEQEVASFGPQPFFYTKSNVKATKEEIWRAICKTDYFKELGDKFDKAAFFSSEWTADSRVHLSLDNASEKATGFVGTVFGNAYLQIDYDRDGFHYSEKILMIENKEENTTDLFFASGPYPNDFEKQKMAWRSWFESVKVSSEAE